MKASTGWRVALWALLLTGSLTACWASPLSPGGPEDGEDGEPGEGGPENMAPSGLAFLVQPWGQAASP
jgi:hypothetical protein